MSIIRDKIKTLPHQPGVYLMKDKQGTVIYVGKAKDLYKRVAQYFLRPQSIQKVANMVANVENFDFFVVHSEYDALALENNLIKKYQPYYNILLKDNKNFAYIKLVDNTDYPYFDITRKIDKNSKLFGPFFAGIGAKEILDIINYAYPVRKCKLDIRENSKPRKTCLFYDMHLCNGPCAQKISKSEYKNIIDDAVKFLKGDTKKIESILTEKMNLSARNENFETALALRDKIKMLARLKDRIVTQLTKRVDYDIFCLITLGEMSAMCNMIVRGGKMLGIQTYDIVNMIDIDETYTQFLMQYYSTKPLLCDEIILPKDVDVDNIKLYLTEKLNKNIKFTQPKSGTKLSLLKMCEKNAILEIEKNTEKQYKIRNATVGALSQLKNDLSLSRVPYRIECYDISNTNGTNTVASMSVLLNGSKAPKHYRKFMIKTVDYIDDFASMREVLTRRFERLASDDISFSSMPDLIIIDGGKGQLSSAVEVLDKYCYPNDLISLAKRLEEVFLPHKADSIMLKRASYSLRLIQLARDEAHRFAITYNRTKRNKSTFKGGLEAIDGVGPATRRALLAQFKTLNNIKNATIDDLCHTPRISENVAKNIYNYYHKND